MSQAQILFKPLCTFSAALPMLTWAALVIPFMACQAEADPALTLKSPAENLLEIYERDQRLLWLTLDAKSEPYAFGFRDDNEGSLSGPWSAMKNGIRHPAWVSSRAGEWRAAIKALEFNVPLHESTFARPGR